MTAFRILCVTVVLSSVCSRRTAEGGVAPDGPDIASRIDAAVEADWIDQDRRFGAASIGAPARVDRASAAEAGSADTRATLPFSTAHTRAVLARARRLADRLRRAGADPERLEPLAAELARLETRLAELVARDGPDVADTAKGATESARRELYLDARRLLRRIAWTNPLLDFDKLLFVKRHDAAGVFHMCDQFYGCNARPGGGLYVLENPFGPEPRLVDLLEHAVVANGRLKGRSLAGGSFLSPEVSFDGRTILFAYSEARAFALTGGKEAYLWAPEYSYHIFRVRADGTELVQLTDGAWNDFDPCFLPNGRIAFISERRGGYLRCGRHCPVYTLFSMAPDGGEITCLSYHETHEWNPSVAHDGRIVYTRWDYVDRDTNIAHHLWTCQPDGRDPRSPHGNYPQRRESRPWMEMQIRAVPGTPRFVASTGAHHGHEFGALVLIDPTVPDDGALSQIERLTPEVPFPEAEGKPIARYMVYGTPWPLGEDDYLCVYDAEAKNRGIYWIDRDGNRELIYRDETISCYAPMPLAPRPCPPVIPDGVARAENAAPGSAEPIGPGPALGSGAPAAPSAVGERSAMATAAVINVYDSDFDWPDGARVTALRVVQVLPKSTPPPNEPRIGVGNQTNARAVLGTVPVEPDGSAYFELPPGKEVYFQALDADGMAIQSMRSGTYAHPGERLTCQGCHERKHQPPASAALPLALRRAPSRLEPGPDGSNPMNYVRLVQGVLDRHCADCHREKQAMDLSATIEGPYGWTRSYARLAPKYGFYYHVGNGSLHQGVHGGARSTPGKFGARASALLPYLEPGHHGVRLPPEDRRRVLLWLDLNSEFYGAYEHTEAQARGEVVVPSLE